MRRGRHSTVASWLAACLRVVMAVTAAFGGTGCVRRNLGPVEAARAGTVGAAAADPARAVEGIRWENVAARAGIHYHWPQQPRPMRNLEAFGCGCAFLDYDNDGWQDVLLVAAPHPLLFRNQGNGRFEEVTAAAGLASLEGDWKGVGVGDVDGDGFPDLALSGFHRLALLHNEHGARFRDVTIASGLDPQNHGHWGSSVGFMDLDGDGALDMVLLNYVIFGPQEKQYCEIKPGIRSGCPPIDYRPERGEVWRNTGGGRFREASASAGMKTTHGKSLVMAFADVDGDGRIDFYIGNDGTPADLMRNRGHMRFLNTGIQSGIAYDGALRALAAMGADWADYDRDGRLDLAVSAFSDESYALFHAVGQGMFELTSEQTGLAGPTYKPLGFGAKWIDVDNDGWPDLLFANGHVYDNVQRIDPLSTFRQPMMLFHNLRGRRFADLVPKLGGEIAAPIVGRGLATADFDNDGRRDFLVVDYEGEPLLFRNTSETGNHWLELDLRGTGRNRFAYGAQVVGRAGKEQWVGQVSPASSYLSSSDPRIHFGLGTVAALESLDIRWPDGRRHQLRHLAADRILRIEEGQ